MQVLRQTPCDRRNLQQALWLREFLAPTGDRLSCHSRHVAADFFRWDCHFDSFRPAEAKGV
jgi:hypothetical protein